MTEQEYKETGRRWPAPDEPEGVTFVRDSDGDLWQRHPDGYGWAQVYGYRHPGDGMPSPHYQCVPWAEVMEYAPIVELEIPSAPAVP